MSWLIPTILFALAFASWRWSWRATDRLVATVRFGVAVLLLAMSVASALAALVG